MQDRVGDSEKAEQPIDHRWLLGRRERWEEREPQQVNTGKGKDNLPGKGKNDRVAQRKVRIESYYHERRDGMGCTPV